MRARLGLLSSALAGASAGEFCEAAHSEASSGIEWAYGPGRALEAAVALGAGQVRVFTPPYRGGSVDGEIAAAASRAAAVTARAAAAGVALVVELSPGTLVPAPEWCARLAGEAGSGLGAVYDPGSMMIEGHLSPLLAVAALGASLSHVHVKDLLAPRREGRRWLWDHVPLGDGLVPWPEVIAALTHAGYRGWMGLDHLGGKPSTAGLHAEVEVLRSLLCSTP